LLGNRSPNAPVAKLWLPSLALLALGLLLLALPASASTAAIARGTRQECMAKLLQPPYDITSAMLNPRKTEIFTRGTYIDVEGCDSWKRLGKYRVQLKQHGQWVDLEGNFWYPTYEYENKFHKFCFLALPTHGIHEEREHGHWQPARVRFINFVKDLKTGKVVAHGAIKDHPVTLGYSGPC
jgi:hypothetical protein